MSKVRVPVYGTPGRSILIDFKAVFGENVYDANGNLVDLDALMGGTVQQPSGSEAGTSDELEEGEFNLFFTDARAVAAVVAILANSANIALTYDPDTGKLTANLISLGQPDGVASLDTSGLVPLSQLPPLGSGVPTKVAAGATYAVGADTQELWTAPIDIDDGGSLELNGALLEVR